MSMSDFENAAKMIAEHPELRRFVGPRPDSLILAAERKLGVRFPETYRRFLAEYGAGSFGAEELFGIIGDDFEDARIPNTVGYTLKQRGEYELPHDLVAVYGLGDGETFYLDLGAREDDEAPIIVYYPEYSPEEQSREIVAKDFGELLLDLVRSQIARRSS
jgi:antitoxin YobK